MSRVTGDPLESVRIDRWLWAARQFKTRTLASDKCVGGKVKINGHSVKPAHAVKIGDKIQISRQTHKQLLEVAGLHGRRLSAKLAVELFTDITPQEEIEKAEELRLISSAFTKRQRGTGRPTKRERRQFSKLKGKF